MSNTTCGGGKELGHNCYAVSGMDGNNNGVINGAAAKDDNSEASSEYSDDAYLEGDPYDFNEEAFDLLKQNHKYAGWVQFTGWDAGDVDFLCSIDWEKNGNAISNNTKLKWLDIKGYGRILEGMDDNKRMQFAQSAKCFYHSIAGNRSIKNLKIERSIMDSVETFSILTPFIENNHNLGNLCLSRLVLDSKSVTILASALSQCNLSYFRLTECDGMTAGFMTQIVDAVGVCGIQNLYLDKYDMHDTVGIALGKSLCKSKSLKTLSLIGEIDYQSQTRFGSITPTGMDSIAASLVNVGLEELYLGDNDIGPKGGEALARGSTNNSTLKILKLRHSKIGIEGGIALAEALEGNSTLKELDISYAISTGQEDTILSADGWTYFFDKLKNCALYCLDLRGNTIGDENIQPMVDSLNTMMSITKLNLRDVNITTSGWITLFELLQRPGGALVRLVELEIAGGVSLVTDEVMAGIANVLATNTSLRKLSFSSRRLADIGWSTVSNLLCNKSNIDTIYDSNHTLTDGFMIIFAPHSVESLLKLTKGSNKKEVASQKIIQYHFLEGNGSNLHEIMIMDVEMMPHVIGFFGRHDIVSRAGARFEPPKNIVVGLELIYRLTRGMPSSLFDTEGKGKKKKTCKRGREE